MTKLFEIIEENGNMSTIGYQIIENNKKYTIIEVSPNDKYGQAMIAYFYNMLNGQNKNQLKIANESHNQIYFDAQKESYILKMGVHPTLECLMKSYENFRKKYDILIKDNIGRLDLILNKGA